MFLWALHNVASTPKYRIYLQEKLNWTINDTKSVHWKVLQTTISSFPMNDHRWLVLFINDKLPLRALKAHPHLGSLFFPSCQCNQEDKWHFVECKHSDHLALFMTLKRQLTQTMHKLQLHPSLFMAIWANCNPIWLPILRHSPRSPTLATNPNPTANVIRMGSIVPWQSLQDMGWGYKHPPPSPSYEWRTSNDQNHQDYMDVHLGNMETTKQSPTPKCSPNGPPKLQTSSHKQWNQLTSAAQTALYHQPLEMILEYPAPQMQWWATRGHDYFNQQLKAVKKQAILHTKDICSFFGTTTQQTNYLQPPWETLSHCTSVGLLCHFSLRE